jgi:hypothetical protein
MKLSRSAYVRSFVVPPAESPDLIALFVVPLNVLDLAYMVTGAVAATLYGEPRLTNDIDLVINLSTADVSRLAAAFDHPDFYVPPVEVMEIEARRPTHGHFNLIHAPTSLKADVYPAGGDPLHRWAMSRRRAVRVGNDEVWIAPAEYVIIRKLEYYRDGGSDKHLRDIRAMLRELGHAIDERLLLDEVGQRGLAMAWRAVSRDQSVP